MLILLGCGFAALGEETPRAGASRKHNGHTHMGNSNAITRHSLDWQRAHKASAPQDQAQSDLVVQLAFPIGASQTREQAKRVHELAAQFSRMDPATAQRLYDRLSNRDDALGQLFELTLHHFTRKSLLSLLDVTRHGQGTGPTTRGTDNRQPPPPPNPQLKPLVPPPPKPPDLPPPKPPVLPPPVLPPPWQVHEEPLFPEPKHEKPSKIIEIAKRLLKALQDLNPAPQLATRLKSAVEAAGFAPGGVVVIANIIAWDGEKIVVIKLYSDLDAAQLRALSQYKQIGRIDDLERALKNLDGVAEEAASDGWTPATLQYRDNLVKRFPELGKAELKPKPRFKGKNRGEPGLWEESVYTGSGEYSWEAKLRDGTKIQIDDIDTSGVVVDTKMRDLGVGREIRPDRVPDVVEQIEGVKADRQYPALKDEDIKQLNKQLRFRRENNLTGVRWESNSDAVIEAVRRYAKTVLSDEDLKRFQIVRVQRIRGQYCGQILILDGIRNAIRMIPTTAGHRGT